MIEAVGANLKEVHEVPFGLSPLDGLSSEKNELVVGLKPIPAKRVRAEGESEANDSGNEFEGPYTR